MVTKFSSAHGVESLAKDLVANYMMQPAAQLALAAANDRFPANTRAPHRSRTSDLKAFGAASVGGVPMPNIPQMASVWGTSAPPGCARRRARARFPRGSPSSAPRRASRRRSAGSPRRRSAKRGARRGRRGPPRSEGQGGSGDQRSHRSRARPRSEPSLARAGIGFFSGTVGLVIKLVLLARSTRSRSGRSAILVADGKWLAALVIVAATALIDAIYLVPDRRLVPLKYLVPGTVFLVAFVVDPDHLERQHRVHQLVDAAQPDEGRGDRRHRGGVARRAGRRGDVHGDAGDKDGELVLLLVDDVTGELYVGSRTASSRCRRSPRRSRSARSSRPRATRSSRGTTSRRSTPSSPRSSSRRARTRSSGRRASASRSRCSRRSATTRRRHVHEHRDRNGLLGQRRGRVRVRRGRGARAGLADARRVRELQDRSSPIRSFATRSSACSSGRSRTRALRPHPVRARPLSSRSR